MYNMIVMDVYILASLEGLIISCSKFHLAILYTSFSCICIKSFHFSISYEFFSLHSNECLRHSSYYLASSGLILLTWYRSFSLKPEYENSGDSLVALTFCVTFSRILSTTFLLIALFSICPLIFPLVWDDYHGP